MGFGKSFLISIVNVFGVIDWNLPIFKYNLTLVHVRGLHRRVDGVVGPASTAGGSARSAR